MSSDFPIELIRCQASTRRDAPAVLFVPGAFTGAWIWEQTFLPFFADYGFDGYAMSFRSHRARGLSRHSRGLGAYISDLGDAIGLLPETPVLVAYSLGGAIAYELARRQTLPGLVLFSAIPPDGAWRSVRSLARFDWTSAAKLGGLALWPGFRRLGEPPRTIYSDRCDREATRTFTERLRGESWRVLAETIARPGASVRPLDFPVYITGMSGDEIVPESEVRRTARALDAPCRIFEGYSHTPFVEPGWESVAQDLCEWIATSVSR